MLKLRQGSLLKQLLSIICGMADRAIVDCSSTALSLQAKDRLYRGNFLMLNLSSDFCDYFFCDQNSSSAIKLHDMYEILSHASFGDTITMKVDNGSDKISFTIERPGRENISDEMKLLDHKNEHLNIHEGGYEVTIEMPSTYFTDFCLTLRNSKYTDKAKISVANKRVKLSNKVDIDYLDTNWQDYVINLDVPEDIATVNTDLTDPFCFTFGLERISLVIRASFMSNTVVIRKSQRLAVVLEYMIEETGYIRFYLT